MRNPDIDRGAALVTWDILRRSWRSPCYAD